MKNTAAGQYQRHPESAGFLPGDPEAFSTIKTAAFLFMQRLQIVVNESAVVSEEITQMKAQIVLNYIGNGSFVMGWPARDLTAADIEHLGREGVTTDQLLQSKLYEYPPVQGKTKQPEPAAGETGKE
jgi:hypothetical protein